MGELLPIGFLTKTIYIGDKQAIKCSINGGDKILNIEILGKNSQYTLGIQTVITSGSKTVVSRPIGDRILTVSYVSKSTAERDIYIKSYSSFAYYRLSGLNYQAGIELLSIINVDDIPSDAIEIKPNEFIPY